MSFLRRIWFAVEEVGVLIVGMTVPFPMAGLAYAVTSSQSVAFALFAAGEALGLVAFSRLRGRHRGWKINYDAENYERERARKRAFPSRSRWRRMAGRIAIWLPSAVAAFVLFFLPAASHLVHLGGVHIGPTRFGLPGMSWFSHGLSLRNLRK